jgi:hypothetical protein
MFSITVPKFRVVAKISGSASSAEVDRLGVAAALEVEGAAIGPAMLVVADQRAGGVGRQRRLAGARQAEEDGGVLGSPGAWLAEQCIGITPLPAAGSSAA